MIQFRCPNCKTLLQIGKEYAGRAVLCSTCNTELMAPSHTNEKPPSSQSASGGIICICGQCKSTFKAPAASADRRVHCPKCGHAPQIPAQQGVAPNGSTLRFACPACGQHYCVLAKYAGKKFKCLLCRRPCPVPEIPAHAEDLLLLEPDQTPQISETPPPQPHTQEPDELTLLPIPPQTPPPPPAGPKPPPRTPEEDKEEDKTKRKTSRPAVKLIAGIIGGLVGLVVGFLGVYSLFRSPGSQTQTDTAPQTPQTRQTAPQTPQTPQAIEFAESVIRQLNQNPENIGDLKYKFPDDVPITDSEIQDLIFAMDIGTPASTQSMVEASRVEIGAAWYQVRTELIAQNGQQRKIRIGFFEITETAQNIFQPETVYWILGITIADQNGTELASAGLHDRQAMTARLEALVNQYGSGITHQDIQRWQQIGRTIAPYLCTIMILLFMARLIILLCQAVVLANNGEPGWAVLVPVHRQLALATVADKDDWMGWLAGLAELILYVAYFFGWVPPVMVLVSLAVYIIFTFIFAIGIAKTHGKGIVFGLGLFFLPILFYPILIFSGSAATD